MVDTTSIQSVSELYQSQFDEKPVKIDALPRSGSNRAYFRIHGREQTVIGVYNPVVKENQTYIYFSGILSDAGISVPDVLATDASGISYLVADLGGQNLLQVLQEDRDGDAIGPYAAGLYRQTVTDLARIQVEAGKRIDYSQCFERSCFDATCFSWDLNYFKYYFLKLAGISYDEDALEADFRRFTAFLADAPADYFLYRDFQSRNVMIHREKPWYIDFQGGRRGPLQYDLASLLYQAKASLPPSFREELLHHYIDALPSGQIKNRQSFIEHFHGFALLRLLQAMGAYGYRGFYEKKGHFLQSIPFALKQLEWMMENAFPALELPELKRVLNSLPESEVLQQFNEVDFPDNKLVITVSSFSYKKGGIPADLSGNGGGFVFDCRSIHNPGRYDAYRSLTGRDPEVAAFLKEKSGISDFLENVCQMVEPAVQNYLDRGFNSLMVSFGCTGGQHRSVYCAESLARHLATKYPVTIRLNHHEQDIRELLQPTEKKVL